MGIIFRPVTMTLTDNETGNSVELPVLHGTIGPRVVDIRKLYAEIRVLHLRPGFHGDGGVPVEHHLHRW